MWRRLLFIVAALATTAWAARETMEESAVHVRELLQYRAKGVGVLMSTYGPGSDSMAGIPIGLQEYYTMMPGSNGDILLLAMPISTIYRNAMTSPQHNMTFTVQDVVGFEQNNGNLAAGRMRIALFGSLERVQKEEEQAAEAAYLKAHPDARGWIGGRAHYSYFARLRVHKIFAFDGFGDVAYIGWIPLDLYRESGAKMRSRKECLRDWPEPRQPGELQDSDYEQLFAESDADMTDEIIATKLGSRLQIQL